MKLLCVSDRVEPVLYGPKLKSYAAGVEAVVSCGDLPFEYLEYVLTFLGAPLYYVLGNHDPDPGRKVPEGCTPLDGRVVDVGPAGPDGPVLAGLSGSPFYSDGPNQYTERQMRRRARALSWRIRRRALLGRPAPGVFVTHAPPLGLGDREDVAHRGFEPFLGLMDRHRPGLWLHGHVHLYGAEPQRVVRHGETAVTNVYGHRFIEV